ncbi:nucleotidyltransferase [Sediminibacillus halophilus]|uniref:tRNA(Met) cytidine acetate ligase n=1 Tax=Sediminibacillus halophilus TaxID=482461 RepID=A0A1G9MT12_9BACI|nr:nucleotidyltransferase [Sediminibacillus halophilus]SDL77380.1 Predicted nucleotidyltransferase [Sediminibacillus halophilus]
MNACGLIVEYNPFHFGHLYHLQQSRKKSAADCVVAVMSGNFLQRGEPAIIDKFQRAKAAILCGVDLVIELPSVFAVQNSDLFAKGALLTLEELKVDSVCFGSEHGEIDTFLQAYNRFTQHREKYDQILKRSLTEGYSFPEASRSAYQAIGLNSGSVDLSKPNNILGYSYVKAIKEYGLSMKALSIKRVHNDYHEPEINHSIASATSIRNELHKHEHITDIAKETLPDPVQQILMEYKQEAGLWHNWQDYFDLLQYRILTMQVEEIREIHGVEEGLEYRLKETAAKADSFINWMTALKTKRYTWTRLQRIFVHLLLNNQKQTIQPLLNKDHMPHLRILAMNKTGRAYVNHKRKVIGVPLVSQLKKQKSPLALIDEKASNAYYSVTNHDKRSKLRRQELTFPYMG